MRNLVLLTVAATVALAGCAGPVVHSASGPGSPAPPTQMTMPAVPAPASFPPPVATNTVAIANFSFSPKAIVVKAGTEVTWTNNDADAHTVTFDATGQGSAAFQNGESFKRVFSVPGTYRYHCSIHPYMVGEVAVVQG